MTLADITRRIGPQLYAWATTHAEEQAILDLILNCATASQLKEVKNFVLQNSGQVYHEFSLTSTLSVAMAWPSLTRLLNRFPAVTAEIDSPGELE